MDFNCEMLSDKFKKIQRSIVDIDVSALCIEEMNISYAKDISFMRFEKNMFSNSLLRHVDAQKCLYRRLNKSIPISANKYDYTSFCFDKSGKLCCSIVAISDFDKIVTFYISPFIQVSYIATINILGEKKYDFLEMEVIECDDENRIVSCETFARQCRKPYGIRIDCEYYEYGDSKLKHAVRFLNYNANYRPDKIVMLYCQNRILNPEKFEYHFDYTNEGVACNKIHCFASDESRTQELFIKNDELLKLRSNGIYCFG